jgi:glycosyltransferase involved in cell wall biosynthesis
MLEYASVFGQLDILLVVKRFKVAMPAGRQESLKLKVNEKLTIHTISFLRAFIWTPEIKPDVITAQDPFEIGFIGWRIAKKLGVKLNLQIHTDFLSPYFTKNSFLNWIRVKIAKFLLPKADSIRVVSERIETSLLTTHCSLPPIHVLPIYVDTDKLKNAPINADLHKKYPQFEKIILMASRLTKEKNISLAIESMKEVSKQNPKVGLIIVGSGPEFENLKMLTAHCSLLTTVLFEPWTNDLASYYKTADIFLNTSWYEGYGMTLVEAAACGTPIISTDVGVAREVSAVVVGWDTKTVASGILQLLHNPAVPKLPSMISTTEYLEQYRALLSQ